MSEIPAVKHASHGWKYVIGEICWFGFLAGALALILLAAAALVRGARSKRTAAA